VNHVHRPRVEHVLGKTVLTANQVTIWEDLRVAVYRRRLAAVQQGLAERGLDGLVLFSPGSIN
jgi:hypothetical protein